MLKKIHFIERVQLAPAWLGLVWRGGKIIKPFEVLDKRTSGCFTMPSAKKFAADFVEKKKRQVALMKGMLST